MSVVIPKTHSNTGSSEDDLPQLARQVATLPGLRLRGLMCLPAQHDSFEAQREPFARLRAHAASLRAEGIDVDTLSMGMSHDYRAAIFEGSTMVRIGTAIFGER